MQTTAKNILHRINGIASMRRLRDEPRALQEADDRRGGGTLRLHAIRLADSVPPAQAEPSVKRTVGPALLCSLHAQGQAACGRWLRTHAAGLGRRSSADLAPATSRLAHAARWPSAAVPARAAALKRGAAIG